MAAADRIGCTPPAGRAARNGRTRRSAAKCRVAADGIRRTRPVRVVVVVDSDSRNRSGPCMRADDRRRCYDNVAAAAVAAADRRGSRARNRRSRLRHRRPYSCAA